MKLKRANGCGPWAAEPGVGRVGLGPSRALRCDDVDVDPPSIPTISKRQFVPRAAYGHVHLCACLRTGIGAFLCVCTCCECVHVHVCSCVSGCVCMCARVSGRECGCTWLPRVPLFCYRLAQNPGSHFDKEMPRDGEGLGDLSLLPSSHCPQILSRPPAP